MHCSVDKTLLVLIACTSAYAIPWRKIDFDAKCGYESCHPVKDGYLNVHFIPHTHDDVGWLKTVDQYYFGTKSSIQLASVQFILDSVITELAKDPNKRFIYVETAFFWKWWVEQSTETQNIVKTLVSSGRLEFIGGAWSMNDEAASNYLSIIDQFTWGLRKLNDTFGECGRPHIGWQIDPFGHSRQMATLFSQFGYDGLFFARLDYEEREQRLLNKTAEMIWQSSPNIGSSADLYTQVLYNHYSAPDGFCFDILCGVNPIVDDIKSPEYNVEAKANRLIEYVEKQGSQYRSNNVILTMGEDFQYTSAAINFRSMDRLIKHINSKQASGSKINAIYSTPSCYLKAVNDKKITFPTKQDDFFPYKSDKHSYWTGYFTSRPTQKYYERRGNNYLQTCKQLSVQSLTGDKYEPKITPLRETMGVMQHHDAITGTEKQHVANDYGRMLSEAIEECEEASCTILSGLAAGIETPAECKSCHLLNISQCEVSENSEQFVLTLYNPLSRPVTEFVRLPIPDETAYSVVDPLGQKLTVQFVPLPSAVLRIPGRQSLATTELVFQADDLPPLGYKSYLITKDPRGSYLNNLRAKRSEQSKIENHVDIGDRRFGLTIDDNDPKRFVMYANNEEVPLIQEFFTPALLLEDEEKLIQFQEKEMLEYFGRKSKSPEPLSKARKLSVDEVSPPVPKRRKKKSKTDLNNSETDIYKSFSYLDVSTEILQQPIEQKDHWGLPPGLKINNGMISQGDTTNSQASPMNYKTKRNSTDSLLLLNFERGSAPPISLSSPELGAEAEDFEEHLRNSYSSSELLYERNLNRFNGYSNNENVSSEAQKIAIYAMDRKNSLRRSPITRESNNDSEEKSIFSDSDSVHSVVDTSKRTNTSSFMSLTNSIDEEIAENVKETIDDDDTEESNRFSGLESETSIESDDDYNILEDKFTNFGSGKRALEHNTSSAFFSTVYYDDDYMSDQKLSDRERSKSPVNWVEKANEVVTTSAALGFENTERRSSITAVISPSAEDKSEKSDSMSQDSLNYSNGSTDSNEYSRPDENKSDTAEISNIETSVDGNYRPRDGIPKYVMLPNPFFKENATASENLERVKFKLSSEPIGIVPPEIPERETGVCSGVRPTLPVITVTETNDRSPKSMLKKIFVPPFLNRQSNGPDRDRYDDQVTRKKSPKRDSKISWAAGDGGDRTPVNNADTCTDTNADSSTDTDSTAATEMIAVRHYGDIVEQYSGVARKPVAKTYFDFEQLKMAAAIECCDEPVIRFGTGLHDNYEEDDNLDEDCGNEDYYEESGDCSLEKLSIQPEADGNLETSGEWLSAVVLHQPKMPEPNAVPYLKIFGNLSLAVFGYWLYMCKDEKLSVPVFGFLLFRFFKTQIWDRI